MNRKTQYLSGLIAPLLFVFTAILGGALRPGYSHITDTVSELFSPGSPNRFLLSTLHTIFALLLTLFGVGLLRFVQDSGEFKPLGLTAARAFILSGFLNLLTATAFPQDPWGAAPTLPGELHIIISGFISLLSILYMILFGIWFQRTGTIKSFLPYTITTVVLVVLSAGWFVMNYGSSLMGVSERVTILIGFQWTAILAVLLVKHD